jgi:hypothetical protein
VIANPLRNVMGRWLDGWTCLTGRRPRWTATGRARPAAGDYLLSGAHNFAVDRQVAQELIEFKPDLPDLTRSVRVFLRRSVQLRAEAGLVELTRWLPDEPAGADPQRFAAYAGVGGNRPLVWCLFVAGTRI